MAIHVREFGSGPRVVPLLAGDAHLVGHSFNDALEQFWREV